MRTWLQGYLESSQGATTTGFDDKAMFEALLVRAVDV
jgi:hypothetical protein